MCIFMRTKPLQEVLPIRAVPIQRFLKSSIWLSLHVCMLTSLCQQVSLNHVESEKIIITKGGYRNQ